MVGAMIYKSVACICMSGRCPESSRSELALDGLAPGDTESEWSEKSEPIQLAGEKVSLASVAGEKLKDGAVAKVASVAKVRFIMYPDLRCR